MKATAFEGLVRTAQCQRQCAKLIVSQNKACPLLYGGSKKETSQLKYLSCSAKCVYEYRSPTVEALSSAAKSEDEGAVAALRLTDVVATHGGDGLMCATGDQRLVFYEAAQQVRMLTREALELVACMDAQSLVS